jgi:hypothetical protein
VQALAPSLLTTSKPDLAPQKGALEVRTDALLVLAEEGLVLFRVAALRREDLNLPAVLV